MQLCKCMQVGYWIDSLERHVFLRLLLLGARLMRQ